MHSVNSQTYDILKKAYDHFNLALFTNELPDCLITIRKSQAEFGYFSPNRFIGETEKQKAHEIALNPSYFAHIDLKEICQTLVHEMCHMWDHIYGKGSRSGYHNKLWAKKMKSIGLIPSSTGLPGGKETGESIGDYPLEGGEFEKSYTELIASGFAIIWKDRNLSEKEISLINMMKRTHTSKELYSSVLKQSKSDDMDQESRTATNEGAEIAEIHHIENEQEIYHIPPEFITNHAKSGKRARYTCPSCKLHVWGKSGLQIKCIPCDQPLTSIEEVENDTFKDND